MKTIVSNRSSKKVCPKHLPGGVHLLPHLGGAVLMRKTQEETALVAVDGLLEAVVDHALIEMCFWVRRTN